ncbi:MAG: spermine synthase [Flavobacteriales bacterium]|nr:spermine synthase [Flavobacteriales bacterium]
MKIFYWLYSYILGYSISIYKSELNGTLEVWRINGRKVLNSENANYSFDSLHRIFQKSFRKSKIQHQNIDKALILGFGVGSVATILQDEMNLNCEITGIEYDPVINEIGAKYFKTERFKNTNIIQIDALKFVENCQDKFQLIAIDLFNDLEVPEQFMKVSFLRKVLKLLESNGELFFNCIAYNKVSTERLQNFISTLDEMNLNYDLQVYYEYNYVLNIKNTPIYKTLNKSA